MHGGARGESSCVAVANPNRRAVWLSQRAIEQIRAPPVLNVLQRRTDPRASAEEAILASPNEKSRDNVGILLLVLPTASVLELDVGAASAVDLNEVPALHSFHQLRYALFVCLCHAVRKADS